MDALTVAPISADAPCGPDLDMDGDAEFLNFMARWEGQLPAESYFKFEREKVDFAAAFAAADKLIKRTHDIRLYVLLAKLSILNLDLDGFARWLATMAALVEQQWDDVHPRADEGDFGARMGHLSGLDDARVVILPLQYAPLITMERQGSVVFRSEMVALGEVALRENETLPAPNVVARIFEKCELSLLERRTALVRGVAEALAAIEATTIERVGHESAASFKRLRPFVERIRDYLQAQLVKRDPTAGAAETAQTGDAGGGGAAQPAGAKPGAFASLADADAALAAAHAYFLSFEPSSPALMLVGQARESLGKTLYDVLKLLAPAHADTARIFVGRDAPFPVPVSALANTASQEISRVTAEPAASRADALALIDAVALHMRAAEPSSPAPLLLERAKALASRDFLALLGDLLPEDSLNAMKSGH